MTLTELQHLLVQFKNLNILVMGDFFLDRYLLFDPDLAETSIETGLDAHQIVNIRNQPGAAGTVTSNLNALDVGHIFALGVIGDDGQGYDLKKGLHSTNVNTDNLIESSDCFTPTYTKPINQKTGQEHERQDIKNRKPLSSDLEDQLIHRLRQLVPQMHGVIALDQVKEHNCGVLTDRVIDELSTLAEQYANKTFFADSRTRIGDFKNVILKPNRTEALEAISLESKDETNQNLLEQCARIFSQQTGKPAFVTLDADGILATDGDTFTHIPGVKVPPPIDIVGAGDSVSASVVSALCAGASLADAAQLGVLVSSITIQQIGTTGTASPEQIVERIQEID
ncbi:MAG: carbohydrate kinase [Candidatus Latescibacteria bacterium]|jgi:rfaE bifunctional protein kinase chain/domain|nr:carbohydrate kinase [Candidatus Latescibacterota bacterium]MBT4139628.1 carbohydrate kinase [Candidatus Latescibacterota bacterium]